MTKKSFKYNASQAQLSTAGNLLRRYTSLASLEGTDPTQLVEELETCLPAQLDNIADVFDLKKHISPTKGKAVQRLLSMLSFVLDTDLPESRYAPGVVYSPDNRKPKIEGGDAVPTKKSAKEAAAKPSKEVSTTKEVETMQTSTHGGKAADILKAKIKKVQTDCPYREGSDKEVFYSLLSGANTVGAYVTAAKRKKHSEKDALAALKRMAHYKVIRLMH